MTTQVRSVEAVTYSCSRCGIDTEWDDSLGPKPLCPDCWDDSVDKRDSYAEKKRRYCQENKEKVAEQKRRYRQENKEKVAEQQRRYYQNNKEKVAEQRCRYRQNNKEKVAEQKRRYYQNNKEVPNDNQS